MPGLENAYSRHGWHTQPCAFRLLYTSSDAHLAEPNAFKCKYRGTGQEEEVHSQVGATADHPARHTAEALQPRLVSPARSFFPEVVSASSLCTPRKATRGHT